MYMVMILYYYVCPDKKRRECETELVKFYKSCFYENALLFKNSPMIFCMLYNIVYFIYT